MEVASPSGSPPRASPVERPPATSPGETSVGSRGSCWTTASPSFVEPGKTEALRIEYVRVASASFVVCDYCKEMRFSCAFYRWTSTVVAEPGAPPPRVARARTRWYCEECWRRDVGARCFSPWPGYETRAGVSLDWSAAQRRARPAATGVEERRPTAKPAP